MKKQPSKKIILHIDTTGMKFNPPGSVTKTEGDRVMQIDAIELVDGKRTGNNYQTLINPEHVISKEATAIHHLTKKDVKAAPVFAKIKDSFLAYVKGADVIAANPWVKGMINSELHRFKKDDNITNYCSEITYIPKMHKALHPDAVTLHGIDGLCTFYKIDSSKTDKRVEKLCKIYEKMSAGMTKTTAKTASVVTTGMFAAKVAANTAIAASEPRVLRNRK